METPNRLVIGGSMIGLEYIVKVYNGTYKKLAEKLEITPPTIMGWLSKKRPIPKAKLEALSKMFHIDEEFFEKELTEVEKIQIQMEYLRRRSKKDSFQIEDVATDPDGNEHEYLRWIDPYEDERRLLNHELEIEMVILNLRASLYTELYDSESYYSNYRFLEILQRLSKMLDESAKDDWNEERKKKWNKQKGTRISALQTVIYYLGSVKKEHGQFMRGQDAIDDDVYDFTVKHDLLRSKKDFK